MERHLRRIFFWVLVVAFCVTAAIIIPLAMGYRYNPERGVFTYGGSVTIKSNPQDIKILIDGKEVTNQKTGRINNTVHIDGLRIGDHRLEVQADGFRDWSKNINIQSGRSVEFWNLWLTRSDYPRKSYSPAGVIDFFYDAQKELAAYVSELEGKIRIGVLDIASGQSTETIAFDEGYSFLPGTLENIEWEPRTKNLIAPISRDGAKKYFLLNAESGQMTDLETYSGSAEMGQVRWDANDRNYIYYLNDQELYRLHIQNPQDKRRLAEHVLCYDISAGWIYYLEASNGIVYRFSPEAQSQPEQVTTSGPAESSDAAYRMIVYDDKRLAIWNADGALYVYNAGEHENYFRRIGERVYAVQFSDDGKKLLFWNDREISAYFLRDWKVQPIRQEDEVRNLARFFTPIANVHWSKDYEHVIFLNQGGIRLLDIDPRSNQNILDITTLGLENTRVVSDLSNDQIFFIDRSGDSTGIFSINFPELEGLLGLGN